MVFQLNSINTRNHRRLLSNTEIPSASASASQQLLESLSSTCTFTSYDIKKLGFDINTDFITAQEEEQLLHELLPAFDGKQYQRSHWDNVIQGYRESEKVRWNEPNNVVVQRIRAFVEHESYSNEQLPLDSPNNNNTSKPTSTELEPSQPIIWRPTIHVLDLDGDGYINGHVDNVKTLGGFVIGLSLLSDSLMQFTDTRDRSRQFQALLPRRSLYVMHGDIRNHWEHRIPANAEQVNFGGRQVHRTRRIAIILRDYRHDDTMYKIFRSQF
jgi:hypothetical protein